jgi:integrase
MSRRPVVRSCPTSTTWESSSLIGDFYQSDFRPTAAERITERSLRLYDQAINRLEKFVGHAPQLGEITSDLLARFASHAVTQRKRRKFTARRHARDLARSIRIIVNAWHGDALPAGPREEAVPPPEPGTVAHHCEVYIREEMFNCDQHSIDTKRLTFRTLYQFAGRHVRLEDQTDALAADFFNWLLKLGKPATTVNRYRREWFCVWRHAHDRELVDRLPRVKRLKETLSTPDSWSVREMQRILAAARNFRESEFYGPVPCNLFWSAILHVAFVTGLRRRSLLAVRHADLDLQAGTLYVPGDNMKNRRAQTFRLSAECASACGRIWHPPRPLFFPAPGGNRLYLHFDQVLAAAEIPPSRRKGLSQFHKIRRTTASMVAQRAGVAAASALLSHSSEYVTARYLNPEFLPHHDATKFLPALEPAIAAG